MFEEIAGGSVGDGFVRRWRRRRAQAVAPVQAELALRVLHGAVPGLSNRWRGGHATLFPGRVELISCVGGVRFLRRKPVTVEITEVDMSTRRTPKGWETLSIHPGCDVVTVRSGAATLELGVAPAYDLKKVLSQIGLTWW